MALAIKCRPNQVSGRFASMFPEKYKEDTFGIDIGVTELLVGKQLGVDCVVAHHPDSSVLS